MTWTLQQLRLPIAAPASVPRIHMNSKIIILLLLVFLIKAAPISVTEPETTDWVDTPKERGTLTIIFSCGTALGLCVWTGVHLNVDPSASGGYKQSTIETVSRLLGKLVWALIALFAPDIVLTVAVHQFLVAYEYQQAVNKFAEDRNIQSRNETALQTKTPDANIKCGDAIASHSEPQKKKKKHMEPKKQMELKMAFFATMGGFCIEEMTVDGPRWKSLKVDTLRRLRTMDIIHDYPLSEIDDKSKASGIAKILVCFQTGWILLQCLARHLNGLHITMLEMNTAVHVLFAIVMYGVWWRKPFDVERSIAIDRYGLCDNSITTTYIDKVRSILEEAGDKITEHAKIQPHNTGRSEIPSNNRRRPTASTLTTVNTSQVTYPQMNAIRAAVTIFRSIGEAPEDAGRMFRAVPAAIKDHFTKNILRRDIKLGILQNYKSIKDVNRDVLEVAYKEAFDAANETAFRFARENVLKAAHEYRSKRTKHETDQDRKKMLEELGTALTEALQKTRRASFLAAFRAAHPAALKSESEFMEGHNLPTDLKAPDTSAAPRIPSPNSLTGATEVDINQLDLSEPTHNTTDLISMFSTSTPQAEALQGFIGRSASSSAPCQSSSIDTNPVAHEVPVIQHEQKQRNASSLPAAFRSACAASRAASRHAVRLVALDAALGPSGAADASEAAIWRFIGDFYHSHFNESFKEPDFAGLVSEAKKTTEKTFRQHFDRAAADFDTNIGVTSDIVERSTATGIFIAAQKAIETAKEAPPHAACRSNSTIPSMVPSTNAGMSCGKAASCTMSMDETVVPLQPLKSTESAQELQVTVSEKSLTSPPSDQAKACEAAENILFSKAFQNIQLAHDSSIYNRLILSLKTAGTVVQDQLMDVPGLFTPSKQRSRRIRKPRSTDGKKAFGFAWRYYHRIILLLYSGVLGVFYGAIHMLKWNSDWFPTPIEHLLWKIACVIGSAAVLPIGVMSLIPFISPRHNYYRIFLLILCTCLWVLFGIARFYIIAESFISLRKLPVEAYEMPSWTNSMPHI